MATSGSKVFGTSTSLCKDCINFLLKCAEKEKEEYVVTDSEVTRIFMPNGEIEHIGKEL